MPGGSATHCATEPHTYLAEREALTRLAAGGATEHPEVSQHEDVAAHRDTTTLHLSTHTGGGLWGGVRNRKCLLTQYIQQYESNVQTKLPTVQIIK